MEGAEGTGVDLSRKFVSEAELDERRKKRQEEWEKIRKPDDPEGKNTYPKLYKTSKGCPTVHVTPLYLSFVLLRGPRGGV